MKKLLLISFTLLCSQAWATGTCTAGAIATAAVGPTPVSISGCWYVSAGGSDTNNGTTEATAFAHAPGMQNCTNNCASASVGALNGVIFRGGGDSWGNTSYMWSLSSGTTGNPTYYGADVSWFSGGLWTKPLLTAGGTAIGNNDDTMISVPANVTFGPFEITGFFWSPTACTNSPPFGECGIFDAGQNSGQTVEYVYIHGWTHSGTDSSYCGSNTCIVATVWAAGNGGNSVWHDTVVTGQDVANDHSMSVWFDGPPIGYNNYCRQAASCSLQAFPTDWHSNTITDVGPAWCNTPSVTGCTHENGFEDDGDTGFLFYNNLISNVHAGIAITIAPYPTYTANVFNNVMVGNDMGGDANVIGFGPPVYNSGLCSGHTVNNYCTGAGTFIMENNTIECGSDSQLFDSCQSNVGLPGTGTTPDATIYRNNHFISATTASGCGGSAVNCTFAASNIVQTLATANGQGYNSSQTYAFSPTLGGSTIGAGSNQTSGWPGPNTNDTSYGCTDASNVATCPARISNPRPPTGTWNSGAYQFVQGNGGPCIACFAYDAHKTWKTTEKCCKGQ